MNGKLPSGFVYLSEIESSILEEIRYASIHNFLGRPVKGYLASRCILTRKAACALARVQAELKQQHKTLKVYDGYRPQRAVDDFAAWSEKPSDLKMKKEFYPRVNKSELFREGYIARHSTHSRGSAVDLTVVPLPVPAQGKYQEGDPLLDGCLPKGTRFDDNSIEMGTGFDVFDVLSHTMNRMLSPEAQSNRLFLKSMMEKYGFKNYEKEWWHYDLIDEPFPLTFFDFEIQ